MCPKETSSILLVSPKHFFLIYCINSLDFYRPLKNLINNYSNLLYRYLYLSYLVYVYGRHQEKIQVSMTQPDTLLSIFFNLLCNLFFRVNIQYSVNLLYWQKLFYMSFESQYIRFHIIHSEVRDFTDNLQSKKKKMYFHDQSWSLDE